MIDISPYLAITYGDLAGFRSFIMDHANLHQQYSTAILVVNQQVMPFFNLYDDHMVRDVLRNMSVGRDDRLNTKAINNWLTLHSQLHQAEIEALSLQGNIDLYDADFTTAEGLYDWMTVHQTYHNAETLVLGG